MGTLDVSTSKAIDIVVKVKGASLDVNIIDQFAEVLPQQAIDGYEVQVPELLVSNLPSVSVLTKGAPVTGESVQPEETPLSFECIRIGGDLKIDTLLCDMYSNLNDMREFQIRFMKLAVYRTLCSQYLQGTGASGQMSGLVTLAESTRTVGADGNAENGGTMTVSDMDHLMECIDAAPVPDYFLAHPKALTQYANACNQKGFKPERVWLDGFDRPFIAHRGIPILRCDNLPITETKNAGSSLTSIYAVVVGWERGLCGIYPAVRKSMITVDKLHQPDYDQERYRVMATCGLALFSRGALARLNGITYFTYS